MADPIYLGATPVVLMCFAFLLPLISLATKRKYVFDAIACLATFLALAASTKIFIDVWKMGRPILYRFAGWPPPLGVVYEVDAMSALIGLVTAVITFLVAVYSIWYSRRFSHRVAWYYTLLLALEAGMLGCIYTGDVFNFFVMMELMAIAAYALVAFYRWRIQPLEAAIKYAMLGAAATTIYFLAVLILYTTFGTLNMGDLAAKARGIDLGLASSPTAASLRELVIGSAIAVALSLWTFTYLAALFPNHFWLPDAHPEAPTPISALLSGVVVKVGVYASIRFFYTLFDSESVLGRGILVGLQISIRDLMLYTIMILGMITSLLGSLLMIVQKDVKRLLAYSTISHIGLLFMGLSIGLGSVSEEVRVLGIAATLFHLVNHALGKALLFLAAGVLITIAGTRNLEKWNGVGKLNVFASMGIVIGALHLLGIPPLGGFFSKLMLIRAFIASGMVVPLIVIIVSSVLALPAYIRLVNAALLGSSTLSFRELSAFNAIALVLLVLACIVIGLLYIAGYVEPSMITIARDVASKQAIEKYIAVIAGSIR